MKDFVDEDKHLWRKLYSQAILAIFLYKERGMPIKSEEWLGVIKDLYGKVFSTDHSDLEWKDIGRVVSSPN